MKRFKDYLNEDMERPPIDEHDDGREFPGEKLRNLMTSYFNYFQLVEDGKLDREHPFMKKQEKTCIDNLDNVRYWLSKIK